ncbi:MAG: FISUMP domain-containing protein [Bacteroidota bacterium]
MQTHWWYWANDGNGTNSSGFNGLPGGDRNGDGAFYGVGKDGYWWSCTEANTDGAWGRDLFFSNGNVNRYSSNEGEGFSVRCLRD